jgi:hypothetical protein
MLRIDPMTNRIVARIPGVSAPMAADSEGMWALEIPPTSDGSVTIVHIDGTTNTISSTIPVSKQVWDLQTTPGRLLVLEAAPSGGSNHTDVAIIDTDNTSLISRIPLEGSSTRIAAGEGSAWLGSWISASGRSTDALRIDVESGQIRGKPVSVGTIFRPIAVADEGVWFLGGPEGPRGICHLSLASLNVDTCIDAGSYSDPAFYPVVALDPASRSIWVSNWEDTVTRIGIH